MNAKKQGIRIKPGQVLPKRPVDVSVYAKLPSNSIDH